LKSLGISEKTFVTYYKKDVDNLLLGLKNIKIKMLDDGIESVGFVIHN